MRSKEVKRADHHQPMFHFRPESNWMNDPNGPLFYEGQYHLFYQYNPNGASHGTIHWGHAKSSNLLHWEHLPIALAPDEQGPDKDGVWSGCAVVFQGTPILVYTGVYPETQCLAVTTDLIHFSKHQGNPVIAGPPADLKVTGFRDPYIWQEKDGWYMALGSGIKGVGGAVLLYKSKDLQHWEYVNLLCIGDVNMTKRDMWECPNFFPLGGKHVLIVSPYDKVQYWTGNYSNHSFTPEHGGFVDVGESYYAPNTFVDGQGRLIMWGWLKEQRSREAQTEAGWSGVMSLPRILHVSPEGLLCMKPAEEIKELRAEYRQFGPLEVKGEMLEPLGLRGNQLEIVVEFELVGTEEFGLIVAASPDGEEETRIGVRPGDKTLFIDTTRSSLSVTTEKEVFGGNIAGAVGDTLRLHIFLDHSVIEVFANDATCLTGRIYPTLKNSVSVGLYSRSGTARVTAMDVWHLNSVWLGRYP